MDAKELKEVLEILEKAGVRTFKVTVDGVQVNLSTSIRESTKDGVTYYGNNVTIDAIQVLARVLY